MAKVIFRATIYNVPSMLCVNTGHQSPECWVLRCNDGDGKINLTFYSVDELERFAGSVNRAIQRLKNENLRFDAEPNLPGDTSKKRRPD